MSLNSAQRRRTPRSDGPQQAVRRPQVGGQHDAAQQVVGQQRDRAAGDAQAGSGPQPKISRRDSGTSTTAPITVTMAGNAMLPVPRITADSELNSHTSTAPANTQLE